MAIPSQEELELDLQTLADYQRLKRNGSFPENLFLIGVLRGGSGGGGTGGGGDASAFNQTIEIARLTSIRDRLPGSFGVGGALRTDSSGVTQPVSGDVTIGNFPATQGIFGSVSVSNFPATQAISAGREIDAALITEPALTVPGSTTTRPASGYSKLTYQIDAVGITNAVLRMEGNLTGSTFVNLSDTGADRNITTPGTYLFTFEGKISAVRMTLVSMTGTAPSLVAHLLRGN